MRLTAALLAISALFLLTVPATAETGLLDRSVKTDSESHRYKVYVPTEWKPASRYPVIVFLHANGRQGTDGSLQLAGGSAASALATVFGYKGGFPAVVIFPQAAADHSWATPQMEEMVSKQIDETVREFHGDVDRIYLMGHSMGGSGALRLAARWPDRFAAVAESSGWTTTSESASKAITDLERATIPYLSTQDPFAALATILIHVPIWVFHGDADETVPVEQSRQLVAALRKQHADVHYTEYSGSTHTETGAKMTSEKEFIPWLLSQRRLRPALR